jgi:hypothetical protein
MVIAPLEYASVQLLTHSCSTQEIQTAGSIADIPFPDMIYYVGVV